MTKVGAGPTPIELEDGWLMFYHGVLTSCNGFTYAMGAAILDKDQPWIVKHRADRFLLAPHKDYELVGDVPNVVFPCASLADADSGKIAIYYGGADTVVALAFTTVDEVVDYIKANDLMNK
jgi:beta-1,4-mannooligosaccharide/beta-1,4-mannosyl-N-acetylglucosamine phosphorylase